MCGLFAALLLILILAKLICFPQMIKEDMKNPIMASVVGTGSMALMILSTYAKPWIGQAAYGIWLFAILLHVIPDCVFYYNTFYVSFRCRRYLPAITLSMSALR